MFIPVFVVIDLNVSSLQKQSHHLSIDWEQLDDWTHHQLHCILEFCEQHQWKVVHISESQSRVLSPIIAIWQVTFLNHHVKTAWIITGDVPIEIVPFHNIPTAREALRSFSKKYLHRAQLMKRSQGSLVNGKEVIETKEKLFIDKLLRSAGDLLVIYHEASFWE